MANSIKGVIAIISNYGVGKTTFALECGYHPKDIVFVNDDLKETGFETDFRKYIDLVAVSEKLKVLEFHHYCLNLIDKLPKSKVIIWDTWTQCQATFPAYVMARQNEFRDAGQYSSMGRIKKGEMYQDAYRYEGIALTKLKNKCDLLILTFHLKQHYLNNVAVPGKFQPGHDRAIEKYADLRIWLTPNINSQVPVGLVMKNISRRRITDQGIQTSQVLPLKIKECNWQTILKYWDEPIGSREPTEDERPNSFELSLIEGTLTPENKRLYEASLSLVEQQTAKEQAEQLMVRQSQEKAIKEYINTNFNGAPNPVKLNGIKAAIEAGKLVYNDELTLAKVSDWS
jgi:hypothetical protein